MSFTATHPQVAKGRLTNRGIMVTGIENTTGEKSEQKIVLWQPAFISRFREFDIDRGFFLQDCALFRGLPNSVYHSIQAFSSGIMGQMDKNLAYTKWRLDHFGMEKKTPAMSFGSAAHACCLGDPDWDRYVRMPELNLRKKDDQAERDWYHLTYGADYCIDQNDYDNILAIRAALWNHPQAKIFLAAMEEIELSTFWLWESSLWPRAILNKARYDGYCPSLGAIIDLKTTLDASPKAFSYEIEDRRYFRQAAQYLSGAAALGLPVDRFIFIAVEKTPPFSIGVYALSPRAVKKGIDERDDHLSKLAGALESGVWPDYTSNDFLELDLPPRAYL